MPLPPKLRDALDTALLESGVYVLGLVCPEVPSWAWKLIIEALLSGDLTPTHIGEFMKAHNLVADSSLADFPEAPNQDAAPSNINP